jgi:hypothetical protein
VILERLLDYILETSEAIGGAPNAHLARFPSNEWNVASWSYRLVRDLLLKRALHESRLDGLRLRIADRLTASAHSYHWDCEYKALLFSALRKRSPKDVTVLLPEIGPYGFDLLMARCAGFSRFVAYDKDEQTIDTCRRFHAGLDLELIVSTSATFDFAKYVDRNTVVVFPDWPHDELARRLAGRSDVVRYSHRAEARSLRRCQRDLGVAHLEWAALFDAMRRLD